VEASTFWAASLRASSSIPFEIAGRPQQVFASKTSKPAASRTATAAFRSGLVVVHEGVVKRTTFARSPLPGARRRNQLSNVSLANGGNFAGRRSRRRPRGLRNHARRRRFAIGLAATPSRPRSTDGSSSVPERVGILLVVEREELRLEARHVHVRGTPPCSPCRRCRGPSPGRASRSSSPPEEAPSRTARSAFARPRVECSSSS
jgi:hypothetical protein